jgi:hypothetical protein
MQCDRAYCGLLLNQYFTILQLSAAQTDGRHPPRHSIVEHGLWPSYPDKNFNTCG